MRKINNNLLVVEVPETSDIEETIDNLNLSGNNKYLGKLSEISEEDCKRFVENKIRKYYNYSVFQQLEELMCDTAKESLISLLQANDIDTSNEDKILIIEVL